MENKAVARSRRFVVLPLAIVLSIFMLFSVSANSVAAQSVSISPSRGGIGCEVTISGSGFTSNTDYEITMDGETVATGTTDSSGSVSRTIKLPSNLATGKLVVKITVGETSDTCSFTLVATKIEMDPNQGTVGTSVSVSGQYFPASTSFTLYFDGDALATGTTNSDGFFSTKFTVPSVSGYGSKKVVVKAGNYSCNDYFEIPAPVALLSTAQGIIGSSITIRGQNFPSNKSFTIRFEDQEISEGSTDSTGSINTTVKIPSGYPNGRYTITLSVGDFTNTQYFDITPGIITLNPSSGTVGSSVQVSGKGFSFQQKITVSLDGRILGTVVSTQSGTFDSSFNIISCSAGQHQISAKDAVNNIAEPLTFEVIPQILCDSSGSVSAGNSLTVSGNGFATNAYVILSVEGAPSEQSVQCDSYGTFPSTSLKVADISGGKRKILATDSAGNKAISGSLSIVSNIENTGESSCVFDQPFSFKGRGFPADEKNLLVFLGSVQVGIAGSDSKGNIVFEGKIPAIPGGEYKVSVRNSNGQVTVSSWELSVISWAKIDTVGGFIGQAVRVAGKGYLNQKSIQVFWDGSGIPPHSSIVSDNQGTFTGAFSVPRCHYGLHKITLSDGSFTSTFDWQVEQDAPPVPTPLEPGNGIRIGHFWPQTAVFKWSEVNDLSGTSYQLMISKNSTFGDTTISKEALENPFYVVTKSEALGKGQYYWCVRAIDGAENTSEWSSPFKLQIGSVLPYWMGILCLSFLLAVIVTYRFIFGFSSAQKKVLATSRAARKMKVAEKTESDKQKHERIEELMKLIHDLAETKYGVLELAQLPQT